MKSYLGNLYKTAPDVHRRVQSEGAIKTTIKRTVGDLDAYGFTDNAELTSFDSYAKPLSDSSQLNFEAVKQFVVTANFPHRRNKSALKLETARDNYDASIRECNLCPKCYKPLKTKRAQVVIVTPTTSQKARMLAGEFDAVQAELAEKAKAFWAELRNEVREKTESFEYIDPSENSELVEYKRFKHIKVTTIEFADIPTHYRVFQNGDRYFYGLVDGTKIDPLRMMPIRRVDSPNIRGKYLYFDHFGQPVNVKSHYRITDLKCSC